jgi:hypothetical protein
MRAGALVLITVPADMRLWSTHDETLLHYRRYDIGRLRAIREDLPVNVRLLCYFNSRLYLPVRMVVANALSLPAWLLFHRIVQRRWGRSCANWALVWLVAFPGALLYQFNYTESLFLLLVMISWWGLEQWSWGIHSIRNLWDLPKFVTGFLMPSEWHAFTGSVLDRCVFLVVLYWTASEPARACRERVRQGGCSQFANVRGPA